MTNELHEFLRTRRSVRRFQLRPVPEAALQRILETAVHAPSAHNNQPWRFAVLTSHGSKETLAEAMTADFRRDLARDGMPEDELALRIERSRSRIVAAPLVIVLCMDASGMDSYPDAVRQQAETTMAIQSTALAGLQLMLAAHAEGLASVWTCGPLFTPETVRKVLELPAGWLPQAMFFVGYPAETPREKTIRPPAGNVLYIP